MEHERQQQTDENRKYYQGLPITSSALIFPFIYAVERICQPLQAETPHYYSEYEFNIYDYHVSCSIFICMGYQKSKAWSERDHCDGPIGSADGRRYRHSVDKMRYKDRAGNLIIKETKQDKFLRALYTNKVGRLLVRILITKPVTKNFCVLLCDSVFPHFHKRLYKK